MLLGKFLGLLEPKVSSQLRLSGKKISNSPPEHEHLQLWFFWDCPHTPVSKWTWSLESLKMQIALWESNKHMNNCLAPCQCGFCSTYAVNQNSRYGQICFHGAHSPSKGKESPVSLPSGETSEVYRGCRCPSTAGRCWVPSWNAQGWWCPVVPTANGVVVPGAQWFQVRMLGDWWGFHVPTGVCC